MPGLGTVMNVIAIFAAGILGIGFGGKLPERMRDGLMTANAVAVLFIGIGGAMSQMLKMENGALNTTGTMMMIASLAIGAVLGEWWDLEDKIERFGAWLKEKTGNSKDTRFVDAFVTASLTVCVGAMAVVGSIEDGIMANHSILLAKAILDFVIILVMSASMGKGCMFSAIPVGIFQGCVTVLALVIKPLMTETAIGNLSYVGSILIFCVGVNLFWGKKVRVANLLPGLIIAVAWAFLPL